MHLPLYSPDDKNVLLDDRHHSDYGNGLIGPDPQHPEIVVAANGGSDLVYFPANDPKLVSATIAALLAQDYVSGLFVDETLGRFPGTLPLSAINLSGSAVTPMPAIAVNFRTEAGDCTEKTNCEIEIADTALQQGQGMHGSFGRGDTMNFMAAIGPDFKTAFVDPAPASNADIGKTLAHILGLHIADKGKLVGRVLDETMPGGQVPEYLARTLRSAPAGGLATELDYQLVGGTRYFDAAGFPGRTLGLGAPASARWRSSVNN